MSRESPRNVARWVRQQLEGWQTAGVTHLERARLGAATAGAAQDVSARPKPMPPTPAARPSVAPAPPSEVEMPARSRSPASPAKASASQGRSTARPTGLPELDVLAEAVRGCTRCDELARTRTQTVFGVGNPRAKILFIGEAPGADEDEQGEPFVGRAGQLLNDIITACRLTREEIYICNILKCRPPGNRTPEPDECGNCREFLDGQLAAIKPAYIVCWGAIAAKNLLNSELSIGKLRGRFFEHQGAKVLCTYHPSYLLRNPAAKKDVWNDMKFLFADMGVDLSQKQ